ncbi:MAG TPA: hypothetical protein VFZ61_10350, partial [Polyangiales bacterium]
GAGGPARGCVNPAHLRPGTPRENAADRVRAEQARRDAERAAEARAVDERIRVKGHAALNEICPDAFDSVPLTITVPRWLRTLLPRAAGDQPVDEFVRQLLEEYATRTLDDEEYGVTRNHAYLYILQLRLEAKEPRT